MVVRIGLACVVLAACGEGTTTPPDAAVVRERVALVPLTAKRDVDVLFVIDDSASVLHLQTSLKNAFPAFVAELMQRGPLPGLHLGVVTSDLGTLGADDAQPGPSIGSGPGSCSGFGKNAALLTNGTTLVSGNFIADIGNADGTRTTNYTSSLRDAFAAITSVGSSGCGFEQPLEAARRALDNHPMNAGFLRPDAALAVITLQDEDDCSFVHSTLLGPDTATFGPLQSFRCTRFGVTCDVGGTTTDEMNVPGAKSQCHWNDESPYLTSHARYESFFASIKPDPREVLFAAIAADASALEVELRTPPGGGTAIPAVGHACTWSDGNGPAVADPAVRVAELTRAVPRGHFESICTDDFTSAELGIAREIRSMLGDACLTREIALPADCEVFDQPRTSERRVPACSQTITTDCYQLVEDASCTTSHHLRVEVTRSSPPAADTMVLVRCKL